VFVVTRHDLHSKIVIEALKNNKNVHVEKPLCLNEQELKDIIKIKTQGRLMVGFNRRFAPHVIKAKESFKNISPLMIFCRVNAGFIPKEHWVHDSKQGGGRIIGEACHFIDLCQFLAGSLPKNIYANLIPRSGNNRTEDNVSINIDFENGSQGIIIYTAMGPKTMPKEYIEIFGGELSMIIDNFKSSTIYNQRGKKTFNKFNQDKGHYNEFKSFIEAIQQSSPSPIPMKDIVYSTQTTFDALKSIVEKRKIDITNIWE
jgi:predicted dehydrogenase